MREEKIVEKRRLIKDQFHQIQVLREALEKLQSTTIDLVEYYVVDVKLPNKKILFKSQDSLEVSKKALNSVKQKEG